MKMIDGMDYSWHVVGNDILSLKSRLGFSTKLRFLNLEVLDDGAITFHDPITRLDEVLNDKLLSHYCYRVLFYYSKGDDTFVSDPENEEFTKISLLDDSMHLGCSTNQHRIEHEFQKLFDDNLALITDVFTTYFGAMPVQRADVSFRVSLLPRVPAMFVYYAAEDESEDGDAGGTIPSSLNIFFEKNTIRFLPPNACETLEDIFLIVVKRILEKIRIKK
ncbi:MAG: DUF3786 domain-containing protein [Promethearchaeota archaeon]